MAKIVTPNGYEIEAELIKTYEIGPSLQQLIVRKLFFSQDCMAICDENNKILERIDILSIIERV